MTAGPAAAPLGERTFCFGCGPEVPCFTECCSQLNLMLTPYDVLRLARRLGVTTGEMVERHAYSVEEPGKLPALRLEMRAEDGRCPFVTAEGCTVYEDRPSACRAYPVARAATRGSREGEVRQAFFLVREDHCKGFGAGRDWTGEAYCLDQGLEPYFRHNDSWMTLLERQREVASGPDADRKARMWNLASYDLDGFRRFVRKSGLVEKMGIPEARARRFDEDDEALMRFAVTWLKFALYGERFNPERP